MNQMPFLDFFKNIGPTEIVILVVVLVIFFGSKIAIGIARTAGETVKEVKKIKSEITGTVLDKDTSGANQREVSK